MGFTKKDAPNCFWCPYQKNCLFSYLDKPSKKEWKEMRIANRYKKGETIFREGEKPSGLYVVCRGRAKIYKTSRTGEQLLTKIEAPGDLLGHRALLSGEQYTSDAEAMDETVVSLISTEEFHSFLKRHFNATLALLRALSLDVRRGEEKARDIAFKPARSRLADILLRFRPADPKAKPLVPDFKRRELAEMAGLTVETTVRLLKDFVLRGLIAKQEKFILIKDPERLKMLAGSASPE